MAWGNVRGGQGVLNLSEMNQRWKTEELMKDNIDPINAFVLSSIKVTTEKHV